MGILDIIISLLVLSWVAGFLFRVGGGLIHILLILAVIGLLVRLFGGLTS